MVMVVVRCVVVNILSTVATENTCTIVRWLALERACHRLHVSFSGFVLRFSPVQALCNVASVVLKLLRLDEICVPLEISLST